MRAGKPPVLLAAYALLAFLGAYASAKTLASGLGPVHVSLERGPAALVDGLFFAARMAVLLGWCLVYAFVLTGVARAACVLVYKLCGLRPCYGPGPESHRMKILRACWAALPVLVALCAGLVFWSCASFLGPEHMNDAGPLVGIIVAPMAFVGGIFCTGAAAVFAALAQGMHILVRKWVLYMAAPAEHI